MTKFSNITWRQSESTIRQLSGAGWDNPPGVLYREMANIILMYVWRILDGKHDWAYRKAFNLTVKAGDSDFLFESDVTALNLDPAVAPNYIRSGSFIFRTGDRVFMQGVSTSEGGLAGFQAIVVDGGLTAILDDVVINGVNPGFVPTLADWSGAGLVVQHSQAFLVCDIGNLFLKQVIGISDTVSAKPRVWTLLLDPNLFHRLSQDKTYDSEIAAYLRGDVLEIYQGPSAAAIDTPILEYDGIPTLYTEGTKESEIELFQEYYTIFRDLMEGWVRDWINVGRDEALAARIDEHLDQINVALSADPRRGVATPTR